MDEKLFNSILEDSIKRDLSTSNARIKAFYMLRCYFLNRFPPRPIAIKERHKEKAFYFFISKKDINPHSKVMLAWMYIYGIYKGIVDSTLAAQLSLEVAKEDPVAACANLAYMYSLNIGGLGQNNESAVYWALLGARGGNTLGFHNLGYWFSSAKMGLPQSDSLALICYQCAVELSGGSNDLSLNNLGTLYENGRGTSKDFYKAAICYAFAAKVNYPYGNYNLGRFLEKGLGGLNQSFSLAILHYLLTSMDAATDFNEDIIQKARQALDRLRMAGHAATIDKMQSILTREISSIEHLQQPIIPTSAEGRETSFEIKTLYQIDTLQSQYWQDSIPSAPPQDLLNQREIILITIETRDFPVVNTPPQPQLTTPLLAEHQRVHSAEPIESSCCSCLRR